MPISPAAARERSRLALLARHSPDDHASIDDARRNLAEISITEYVERRLAEAPPLTEEQRHRLAGLFAGGVSA